MQRKWDQLSREEKLASVAWPHLCSKEIQLEMAALAKNEHKKSPLQGRLEQVSKSGKAK
jgi:hypothetical protein